MHPQACVSPHRTYFARTLIRSTHIHVTSIYIALSLGLLQQHISVPPQPVPCKTTCWAVTTCKASITDLLSSNLHLIAIQAHSWHSLPGPQQQHANTPHTHASIFCRQETVDISHHTCSNSAAIYISAVCSHSQPLHICKRNVASHTKLVATLVLQTCTTKKNLYYNTDSMPGSTAQNPTPLQLQVSL